MGAPMGAGRRPLHPTVVQLTGVPTLTRARPPEAELGHLSSGRVGRAGRPPPVMANHRQRQAANSDP